MDQDQVPGCDACHWWRFGRVSRSTTGMRCQRYAPRFATGENGEAVFPATHKTDSCGDFTPNRHEKGG